MPTLLQTNTRETPQNRSEVMDHRVVIIISLMKKELGQELTLDEMSSAVNLTPSHLCRLFKTETGDTPAKYFKQLKLRKAKQLLETTLLSVKEIMSDVGMYDESHFVRDFKFAYGLPPAKYRAYYFSIVFREEVDAWKSEIGS
jgi:transcriptional regulator GlxA family with amidase domain